MLTMTGDSVVRKLKTPVGSAHFLRSPLSAGLVQQGSLVSFELSDERTTISKRLSFVSQPTEWCDAQLFDAGRLTLEIQEQAQAEQFDLKDASAWNILFAGTRPVFCDLLSFEPQTRERWWAAGQFARHFILPLWLAQKRGLHALSSFKCWRDGVDPEQARALLGASRYLHRCWPLLAGATCRPEAGLAATATPVTARSGSFRRGLYASLHWMLEGVRPRAQGSSYGAAGPWSDYVHERSHYPEGSLAKKREQVAAWLGRAVPDWVLDFGCNTGEFSALALGAGAQVIAVDSDHACIERLYRAHPGQDRLHPVVAAIDDLGGGRGWEGSEQPGLYARLAGQADAVLMLALVHHLAVGASVPLTQIARFARACTRRWLIVEWIAPVDSQLSLLARQRCRDPEEFSLQRQRLAFIEAGFQVYSEVSLAPAARTLALLRVAE